MMTDRLRRRRRGAAANRGPRDRLAALAATAALVCAGVTAALDAQEAERRISLAMIDTPLSEVMNMISREERVNILMSDAVDAEVSFNVFDLTVEEAIVAIANAAGYAVERRGGNFFIVERDDAGRYATSNLTQVRTFKLEYADPSALQTVLSPYLSEYGNMSVLAERMLITIEDAPDFLTRFEQLIRDIDHQPQQVLIEAKILEITLTSEDSYGIDWTDLFSINDSDGVLGTRGLDQPGTAGTTGFFLTLANDEIELLFSALEARGRVQTLSTPKLLSLEHQEASVIIGDRRGFQVTTTINQVTTETIQFLESGVILRVTPQVDRDGNVLLDIHPEVSTGNVDANGIPSQVTTEVTTQLIVPSGRTVFIGGLIKHNATRSENGVPGLRRIPGLKRLFASEERTENNSETIVLITPHIVGNLGESWNTGPVGRVGASELDSAERAERLERDVTSVPRRATAEPLERPAD
jgi:type II secretory pathway component GspD/PulD (secretin)